MGKVRRGWFEIRDGLFVLLARLLFMRDAHAVPSQLSTRRPAYEVALLVVIIVKSSAVWLTSVGASLLPNLLAPSLLQFLGKSGARVMAITVLDYIGRLQTCRCLVKLSQSRPASLPPKQGISRCGTNRSFVQT